MFMRSQIIDWENDKACLSFTDEQALIAILLYIICTY